MLSKTTTQLLEEVFGKFGEKARKKAEKEPEALVVSLLLVLQERLRSPSSMLHNVDMALYEDNLKAAREKLGQEEELLQHK